MKHKVGKLIITAFFALLLLSVFAGCKKPKPVVIDLSELNVEWYDENAAEFSITTKEQLYDMAKLSYFYDFFGQTFYLENDIVFNEGNAADWKDDIPEYGWESIYGFAGTFDGQGHTISGLYSRGELYFANIERVEGLNHITSALFRDTDPECVIKDLRLENCYFESDLDNGAASISSNGGGTFENIYSNAIIRSQKSRVGGIIGTISDDCTITNCWFDGRID
ncbi:MAG: hypothetical protein IK088_00400, partial [Lachnospiraceae bacterium]|nr:hypothetical protein [Lachnospiraceae bacterium]